MDGGRRTCGRHSRWTQCGQMPAAACTAFFCTLYDPRPNTCSKGRDTPNSRRSTGWPPTRGRPGPAHRSDGGSSKACQTARQTVFASTPASSACCGVRFPSSARTWSRAHDRAYVEPRWCSIRCQNSVSRTRPVSAMAPRRRHRCAASAVYEGGDDALRLSGCSWRERGPATSALVGTRRIEHTFWCLRPRRPFPFRPVAVDR
jgi:hypothetical protein